MQNTAFVTHAMLVFLAIAARQCSECTYRYAHHSKARDHNAHAYGDQVLMSVVLCPVFTFAYLCHVLVTSRHPPFSTSLPLSLSLWPASRDITSRHVTWPTPLEEPDNRHNLSSHTLWSQNVCWQMWHGRSCNIQLQRRFIRYYIILFFNNWHGSWVRRSHGYG